MPDSILDRVSKHGERVFHCGKSEFERHIQPQLEEARVRYTYQAHIRELLAYMPTYESSAVVEWVIDWGFALKSMSFIGRSGIRTMMNTTLDGFQGRFEGSAKTCNLLMWPPGRRWPSIALEVVVDEPSAKVEPAAMLMEGSGGAVAAVLLMGLQTCPGGKSIRHGFVELYVHDPETGRQRTRRMTLYPVPETHASQKLQFTWEQILREKAPSYSLPDQPPPALYLDDLRSQIELSIKQRDLNRGSVQQGN